MKNKYLFSVFLCLFAANEWNHCHGQHIHKNNVSLNINNKFKNNFLIEYCRIYNGVDFPSSRIEHEINPLRKDIKKWVKSNIERADWKKSEHFGFSKNVRGILVKCKTCGPAAEESTDFTVVDLIVYENEKLIEIVVSELTNIERWNTYNRKAEKDDLEMYKKILRAQNAD